MHVNFQVGTPSTAKNVLAVGASYHEKIPGEPFYRLAGKFPLRPHLTRVFVLDVGHAVFYTG